MAPLPLYVTPGAAKTRTMPYLIVDFAQRFAILVTRPGA